MLLVAQSVVHSFLYPSELVRDRALRLIQAGQLLFEQLYPSAKHEAFFQSLSRSVRRFARVAQLVEQRTENPRVGGSSPPPGTTLPVSRSVDRGSSS